MTSHSRCAKDSASCDTKFCLLHEHRVLADVLLKNFVAAAVFSVSYFLDVLEEFLSCLSKPEGSVCHFGLSIGRAVMLSHSRCAKNSASCDTKFCLLCEHRTSGVGGRVVEEFRSCCCFLGKLFLNVVEEFRSCLSKPEGSVCHFWTLYINQDVVCFSLFAIFEPTDPLWSQNKQTK